MTAIVWLSVGLAVGGVPCAATVATVLTIGRVIRARSTTEPGIRPILFSLLIEVRSGFSVLGALMTVAALYPQHRELNRVARVASVSGLTAALGGVDGHLQPVLSQLARSQISGAPMADTIRAMIEADIARDRTEMIARARKLPTRLMIPVTLLILPGLVLLFYAPALVRLFGEISGPLT